MDADELSEEEKRPAPLVVPELRDGAGQSSYEPLPALRRVTAARLAPALGGYSMRSNGRTQARSTSARALGAKAAADSPSKPKKRSKQEQSEPTPRIAELEREIAAVKLQLEGSATPSIERSRQLAAECLEMKQRTAFLNQKLTEHFHWAQRVSSLMESAPLLEIAFALPSAGDDDQHRHEAQSCPPGSSHCPPDSTGQGCSDGHCDEPALTLSFLDEWRRSSSRDPLSRFILKERLKAVVERSVESASNLVQNYGLSPKSLALFPLQMESRGWHFATSMLIDTSIAFRCERLLPPPSVDRVESIAAELWQSVVQDEIQRTFFPIIQESALAYQDENCCLWHHILQFSTSATARAVATVGSFQPLRGGQDGKLNECQITIGTAEDNYLFTFAADAAGDNGTLNSMVPSLGSLPSGPVSPLSVLDLGSTIRKCGTTNNFVIGLRLAVTDAGVKLIIVGSAVFDLQHIRDPALELLQYLVSYLPVYEELYLQQYVIP